jgi:subtilisin family serine protease
MQIIKPFRLGSLDIFRFNFYVFLVLLFITVTATASEGTNFSIISSNGDILILNPQPDIGYVLQRQEQTNSAQLMDGILNINDADKNQLVGIAGRQGIYILLNETQAGNAALITQNSKLVKYSAPLFSINGQTVAVIPEIAAYIRTGSENDFQIQCKQLGLIINKRLEFTKHQYLLNVTGSDANAVFLAVEQLKLLPYVEWATPNLAFEPILCSGVIPNDIYFPNQWHLNNTGQSGGISGADVNAPQAWEITTGDPNIVIAVLDEGVDITHPDLVNNIWTNIKEIPGNGIDDDGNGEIDDIHGWDFVNNDNNPQPSSDDAHGTACAGLIVAQGNNSIGVTGVTWNCKIMPVRISSSAGFITYAQIATAIRYAAVSGADILSNSWGSTYSSDILHSAIQDVTAENGIGRKGKGCIVLASAGNWTTGGPVIYPAAFPEVIAIGAIDQNDQHWYYSASGTQLDIVAPSGNTSLLGNLWTTDITGNAGYNNRNSTIKDYTDLMGGTSGACPLVAGVAALILSIDPNLTKTQVQNILLHSARDLGPRGWDPNYGFGCVDAYAAVKLAMNPSQFVLFVDDNALHDPGPGNPNVSDPNENGSREHPFDSIQQAIKNTLDGDMIIVLPGIYKNDGYSEGIDLLGKNINLRSLEGPEYCIIDGENKIPGFYLHNGETVNCIIDGFTISNSIFLQGYGGGLFNYYSNPTIKNCIFLANKADYGGAISNHYSSPVITNCIFKGNIANTSGGGIHNNYSGAYITNCTFTSNAANIYGGGIYATGTSLPVINNCIFWNDNPQEIYGNPILSFSDIKGGWAGIGNINTDPLFADFVNDDYHLKSMAGRWDPNSRGWIIDTVHSPCIDAGDPNSIWTEELWPHGKRINMGAYGGTAQASMSLSTIGDKRDLNEDGLINWNDVLLLIDKWNSGDAPQKQDINRNGIVDANDLMFYYGNWYDVNNAVPIFNVINDQNGFVASPLHFIVSAVDIDGDTFVYAVAGLPDGAVFSENIFEWRPEAAGLYEITFIVSDNKSLDFVTVKIRINNIL